MSRFAAAALLALALGLAACGEDDERGSVEIEGATGTEATGTGTTGTGTTRAETTGTSGAETTGTTGTTPEKAPTGEVSKTFRIAETEFELQPASFRLANPGVVEFVVRNTGGTVHALEVEGPTGEVETEEIQPGDTARLKADVSQAGRYKLYCPIGSHEQDGMVGELVVGGGAGGTGGTASPSDDDGGDDGGENSGPGGGSDDDGGNSGSGGGYGY